MIDPEWQLVDLDPRTWRAIGEYFHPGRYIRAGTPDEHGLYILHDDGRLLNAVDTRTGRRSDLAGEWVDDPSGLAKRLYATGEWDRVHIIDRTHLEMVANRAQDAAGRHLHLDEYYRRVYHLIWNGDAGYVAMPPKDQHWNGWTYDAIKAVVDQLQEPTSLALGVIDGRELVIGLIAEITGGMIRKVTTFEALPQSSREIDVSGESLTAILEALETRFAPPAAVMLCTPSVFETWIAKPHKLRTIEEATAAGMAVVQLRDPLASRNGWSRLECSR